MSLFNNNVELRIDATIDVPNLSTQLSDWHDDFLVSGSQSILTTGFYRAGRLLGSGRAQTISSRYRLTTSTAGEYEITARMYELYDSANISGRVPEVFFSGTFEYLPGEGRVVLIQNTPSRIILDITSGADPHPYIGIASTGDEGALERISYFYRLNVNIPVVTPPVTPETPAPEPNPVLPMPSVPPVMIPPPPAPTPPPPTEDMAVPPAPAAPKPIAVVDSTPGLAPNVPVVSRGTVGSPTMPLTMPRSIPNPYGGGSGSGSGNRNVARNITPRTGPQPVGG